MAQEAQVALHECRFRTISLHVHKQGVSADEPVLDAARRLLCELLLSALPKQNQALQRHKLAPQLHTVTQGATVIPFLSLLQQSVIRLKATLGGTVPTCKRALASGQREHAFDGSAQASSPKQAQRARTGAPVATKPVSQHPDALLPYVNTCAGQIFQAHIHRPVQVTLWRP